MDEIVKILYKNRDEKYAEFQSNLTPTIGSEEIIGVRTPILKSIAKELYKNDSKLCEDFLKELPHKYFEENQLHGFILSEIKDFDNCISSLEEFLPFIDNWATCDQTSPKIFKKKKNELLPYIYKWLNSEHEYTVRFSIGMLMRHFLDEDFDTKYLDMVSQIKSERYYINMEIAWYFATALAKQWDDAILIIENKCLSKWVNNKTIQKARESFRVPKERKEYLKSLKM